MNSGNAVGNHLPDIGKCSYAFSGDHAAHDMLCCCAAWSLHQLGHIHNTCIAILRTEAPASKQDAEERDGDDN